MYTIGQLSREFGLSRSTLIYYDSIGILKPSKRTEANYRQYSESDKTRLKQICSFRETGITLEQIKDMIEEKGMSESNVLEHRLVELNQEILYLKFQQKLIMRMLKGKKEVKNYSLLDKETFLYILKSAGLDQSRMKLLHEEFEKSMPDFHQAFLEFLGLTKEEISQIREHSR